jgi:cellulose synthase/poly-beta-1,6-N-acetylglucosamine synthase-like glycosyltransferase
MLDITHSIIIPTHNRPDLLLSCLTALDQAQTPPGNWEVLVMDNSDAVYRDENRRISESFSASHYRYVPMVLTGLMFARHQGVDLARGTLISFIDDDSCVSQSWLHGIQQVFTNPNVGLATGPNYPQYEQTPPNWLESLWKTNEYGRALGFFSLLDFGDLPREIRPEYVWGCNYSIRREVFYQAKGSHPDILPKPWKSYMGDGETPLSIKVSALGYQTYYSPLCAIHHLVPQARLTKEYIGDRAFRFGMHASFTFYRREHGLGLLQGVAIMRKRRQNQLVARLRLLFQRFIGRELEILQNGSQNDLDPALLNQFIQQCKQAGWDFHRRALKNDPALKEYVLRPDFMGKNASLPNNPLPDKLP